MLRRFKSHYTFKTQKNGMLPILLSITHRLICFILPNFSLFDVKQPAVQHHNVNGTQFPVYMAYTTRRTWGKDEIKIQ